MSRFLNYVINLAHILLANVLQRFKLNNPFSSNTVSLWVLREAGDLFVCLAGRTFSDRPGL